MPLSELILRLSLAAVLGAIIGIEREMRNKPAGLRTNTLIAFGAAVFTTLSLEFAADGGTPDRVAAQVVTGVGFLGAGAIMRSGANVQGLTTAATIWVNSAVGMAAGAGEFATAIVAAAVAVIVLAALPPIETFFERRGKR